jgi:NAD(P)H-hydrate epimerase
MMFVNSAQMQEIDRIMVEEYNHPGLLLMDTAGRKSAELLLKLYDTTQRFLILCGPGNNGGDGFAVARYLYYARRSVRVRLTHSPGIYRGDAKTQYRMLVALGIDVLELELPLEDDLNRYLQGGTVIVDALLGVGTRGKLKPEIAEVIDAFRNRNNPVVALDFPTGLIGDTGALLNRPLRCEHTFAFHLPKVCHYVTPAAKYCGEVHVLDIQIRADSAERLGLKTEILDAELIRSWWHSRNPEGHKGTYGHAFVVGGSRGRPGAIALTASGAVESGAGLCTAFIPGGVVSAFHRTTHENMSVPYGTERTVHLNETAADVFGSYLADKSVVAIGPGLGNNEDTVKFLTKALPYIHIPLILDADALNILADHPALWDSVPRGTTGYQTIITPHPGEMARLSGLTTEEVQEKRYEIALQFAASHKVIVVLKGAGTIIAAPNGYVYVCPAGNPGMASGGTGDTLTGIMAGFVAQGYPPLRAAALAVYVHGYSGDLVERLFGFEGVTASKIIRFTGAALKEILTGERIAPLTAYTRHTTDNH